MKNIKKNFRRSRSLKMSRKQNRNGKKSVKRRKNNKSLSLQIGGFLRDLSRVVSGNFRSTNIVPNVSCS